MEPKSEKSKPEMETVTKSETVIKSETEPKSETETKPEIKPETETEPETKPEEVESKPSVAPIIELSGINVTYNPGQSNEVRALENLNLEIYPEEYVIIYGPSGCGKSTLLYAIAGLQHPTNGEVKVEGEDIGALDKNQLAKFHLNKIGMIFQAFHLVSSLNVMDNICLPKVFGGENETKRREAADSLLKRFDIIDQSGKFPSELSGGQKQRVSIARALINNPGIILADEPVGNLDSKSAFNVMRILKELNEIDKKTIILVTHDPAHLEQGDRIVQMKDGKIIKIEVVRKKKSLAESFIFKDGKLKEDLLKSGLIREEMIPEDLKLLMKAFRSLSFSQIGSLLVNFKTQQLFSHIFFSLTDEQIETGKKKLQDVLYERLNFADFEKTLDEDVSLGGAGWDKRTARTFARSASRIVKKANEISFINTEWTAFNLCDYVISALNLNLSESGKKGLTKIIFDRIKNKIGIDEFKKLADMSERDGGLGLDSRTALKIAREIEILLLLRYSA